MLAARWAGVRVGIHGLFLLLLAGAAAMGYTVQVLILLGSLAAHELAHLFAAHLSGIAIAEVMLTPFGGVARLDAALEHDPQAEVSVALAGPFQSCFLAVLAWFLSAGALWDRELLAFFFETNATLAFFNLLPALPLDGGRALRGMLAQRFGYQAVTRWMALCGRLVGVAITAGGLTALLAQRPYWTALAGGPFLVWAAGREEAATLYRSFGQLLRKRQALRHSQILRAETLVALAGLRLREVLPHLAARRYHLVLVVDEQMQPLATLGEDRLAGAFEQYGPEITLAELLEQG